MSDDTNAAHAFAKLLAVVTELRDRCPWDREQKLGDTPRHLIEEAYEVADAIARGNPPDIAEELGDVIVQCLFIGVILAEDSKLDIATSCKTPPRNSSGGTRTFMGISAQRLRSRSSRIGSGSKSMSARARTRTAQRASRTSVAVCRR